MGGRGGGGVLNDIFIVSTLPKLSFELQYMASNHRLSPLWVRVPQVAILRTCPNMTLAVERDVKPQL